MKKFIVTFGNRVILDGNSHRLFDTELKAIEHIFVLAAVYIKVEYLEIVVGQMGGTEWCRYSTNRSLEEAVKDVYDKFKDSYLQDYKIYSEIM